MRYGVQSTLTPPKTHGGCDTGGPGAAPYLCMEAGGIEDGDLVVTAGPQRLVQCQEDTHGAGPHGQAGRLLPHIPQAPCNANRGKKVLRKENFLRKKAFFE